MRVIVDMLGNVWRKKDGDWGWVTKIGHATITVRDKPGVAAKIGSGQMAREIRRQRFPK